MTVSAPAPEKFPLFAFATAMEFSKVFPQDFTSPPQPGTLILLHGKFQGCYACVLGVGMLDFSVALSRILADTIQINKISAVINVGICGAYPGRGLSLLDLVWVRNEKLGDLGFEEKDGTPTLWQRTYLGAPPEFAPSLIKGCLDEIPQVTGATVNCCTGTAERALQRIELLDCDVESMEGAACLALCAAFNLPAYQIRAVSNMASTRDKSRWKIPEALEKLRLFFAEGPAKYEHSV